MQSQLSNDDLILDNITTDTQIPAANIQLSSYNASTNTATFKFTNISGTISPAVLPDGRYRAVISAEDVVINGEEMARDMVLDFFVISADANHDGTVNLNDFNILAANFGSSGNFTQGDFNYDGRVNLNDFNIFSSKFGSTLAPLPDGPGEITVSVLATDQAQLTWIDNVAGETGWRVQRSSDGVHFDWYQNIVADSQSFTPSGLEDGKRYWFRVRAYSDAVLNPSGPNTAYTPKKGGTTLLPSPELFSAAAVSSTSAFLEWTHTAQNATTMVIQRSMNGLHWTDIEIAAGEGKYTDSDLLEGTHYYYRGFLKNDLISSAPTFVQQIDT